MERLRRGEPLTTVCLTFPYLLVPHGVEHHLREMERRIVGVRKILGEGEKWDREAKKQEERKGRRASSFLRALITLPGY